MSLQLRRVLAVAIVVVLGASSALAQKGSAKKTADEKRYDVEFVFDGTSYLGTMTLNIAKGKVSGRMAIDRPTGVTGEVAGTLQKGTLALDYAYQMAGENPCAGRVTVDAKMTPDAASATGTAHAEGCGDPADGSFTLKKTKTK
ncbi:MAG TPA: hypothetical protein VFK20_08280 [Vicinamibacterales bacterium]|nr:hypothetical protein [Vicinamibacterales bacterium]